MVQQHGSSWFVCYNATVFRLLAAVVCFLILQAAVYQPHGHHQQQQLRADDGNGGYWVPIVCFKVVLH
jgi:hypothetical protein